MAGCKVVTRKLVSWHGRDEEFSNVYYFGDGGIALSPSETVAETLAEAVIAAEKLITGPGIRFLGAAVYKVGAADTPGDTDAIHIEELAATGNQGTATVGTSGASVDPEAAVDLKFLLGGRRYLRTMIHTGLTHNYDALRITATTSSALTAHLRAFAEKMLNGPWTGDWQRIAPNGDRPTAIMYNPYLEHRQFHRYRRRNAGLLG